jgi:hypothetical protein
MRLLATACSASDISVRKKRRLRQNDGGETKNKSLMGLDTFLWYGRACCLNGGVLQERKRTANKLFASNTATQASCLKGLNRKAISFGLICFATSFCSDEQDSSGASSSLDEPLLAGTGKVRARGTELVPTCLVENLISLQAKAYGGCLESNLDKLGKDVCAEQFGALSRCFRASVKSSARPG